MSANAAAILRSLSGQPVPLVDVAATGTLNGLLFQLTVEQRYENCGEQPLEAVFTFPLPLHAVLLGFELDIAGRKLAATAVERTAASQRYEAAIDAGDSAALLEHDGNGLYTVSVGNLGAHEAAVIRYRYAQLLDAHHGHVRLIVPTVIAPRYGNPAASGLTGPAVPGADVLAEYPFEIRLELAGLAQQGVRSPSHRILSTHTEDALTVRFAGRNFLDRDFVLEIDAAAVPKQVLVARDDDGWVACATPVLTVDQAEQRPLNLKILLDCSGSMNGANIAAARGALLTLLQQLAPKDRISLTRFGSAPEHITEGLEPADAHTLVPLAAVVRTLAADLGGTEMRGALEATLAIPVPAGEGADLILITDGQIYDISRVVALAARSAHRLFPIAIGCAPVEALARSIAQETGGACEFVAPSEDAAGAISRTFKRLRAMPRTATRVAWPATPDWAAPLPSAVFPGDTLHLLAGFSVRPHGTLRVTVGRTGDTDESLTLAIASDDRVGDVLPGLAAARRLPLLTQQAATALALRHQLVSPWTSLVVVAEREAAEKTASAPVTVAVPHMMTFDRLRGLPRSNLDGDFDYLDIPGPLHRTPSPGNQTPQRIELHIAALRATQGQALCTAFNRHIGQAQAVPATLDELQAIAPLPPQLMVALRALVAAGEDEADVVATLLAILTEKFGQAMPTDGRTAADSEVLSNRRFRGLRQSLRRGISGFTKTP